MTVGWYVGAVINVGASVAINLGTVSYPYPACHLKTRSPRNLTSLSEPDEAGAQQASSSRST